MTLPLLSLVTFVPALGAFAIAFVPRGRETLVRWFAFLVAAAAFAVSLVLYGSFDAGDAGYQFEERLEWMPSLGISYHLGIDGISLLLVLLTTFLTPLALLSSWRAVELRVKEFAISMLLLETGMLGVFVSLDLFLFYIFWEAMLIPMYLIIGVWGGSARIYAAVKFILYTLVGSLLMLVAILALYFQHGGATESYTFDVPILARYVVPPALEIWLFLAFAVAFAIKVPMFPFHTWLPDAHVEAPTAGSVVLAAVLLKMGAYGFLRFCLPLFPHASLTFVPWILLLALVGIIYGAWVSMMQPDLKKLVAYSSVSHLGFVMLGIFTLTPQGMVGGIIQMVNHGLSTGALFLLVGVLYERRHTRLIADFGGLWHAIPAFSAVFMVVSLSSLGLPGLNGFVGEFLILVGAFVWASSLPGFPLAYVVPVVATSGIIFAAVYMLWMYQRVCFGEITVEANRGLPDLTRREWLVLVPVLIFIVWIGVYPRPFTGVTETSVRALIAQVESKRAAGGSVLSRDLAATVGPDEEPGLARVARGGAR